MSYVNTQQQLHLDSMHQKYTHKAQRMISQDNLKSNPGNGNNS